MTDHNPAPATPSRRTVVKGAAWAAPVVVAAGTVPALAASPPVVMSHLTRFNWYDQLSPTCPDANSLRLSSADAGTGVTFATTTPNTRITDVGVYFWNSRSDIVWTPISGNSGCWTTLSRDGVTEVRNGVTYYRYASVYTCPITAVAGVTQLQPYAWTSQCYYYPYGSSVWYQARTARRQAYATVNGVPQSSDTGYFVQSVG